MSGRPGRVLAGAAALATLLAPSCVGPARSAGSYAGKAGATAQEMRSALETARAGVGLVQSGKGFSPYLSEVFHYAEDDAGSIQGAFDSIQPPDASSDQLRDRLDELLSGAVSIISELRIEARRGDFSDMPKKLKPLAGLSRQLDDFVAQHPPGGPR